MSGYNLPPGCLDASDLDYYNRVNPEPQCPGCKQAESDCECCMSCGATPDQACEPECGRAPLEPAENEDVMAYWQDRSELFTQH